MITGKSGTVAYSFTGLFEPEWQTTKSEAMVGNRSDREDDDKDLKNPGGDNGKKHEERAREERVSSQQAPGRDNMELDEELRGHLRRKNEQNKRSMRDDSGRSEMQDTR